LAEAVRDRSRRSRGSKRRITNLENGAEYLWDKLQYQNDGYRAKIYTGDSQKRQIFPCIGEERLCDPVDKLHCRIVSVGLKVGHQHGDDQYPDIDGNGCVE
jgi:hypothetical protein